MQISKSISSGDHLTHVLKPKIQSVDEAFSLSGQAPTPSPGEAPRRVTLKDVAKAAGVVHTTVSRALKNHPGVQMETRKKIQALADSMGYRPDPMLQALATYRRELQLPVYQSTLGWLTNYPGKNGWRTRRVMEEYLGGAKARAEKLGFGVTEIWQPELAGGRDGARTLAATLRARGIRGLLVPPHPMADGSMAVPREDFTAVALGFRPAHPAMHSVSNFHYGSTMKLVRGLLEAGFRKPALVCDRGSDGERDFSWSAGFRAGLAAHGALRAATMHMPAELKEDPFLRWFEKTRPDVLVADAKIRAANDLERRDQNRVHRWLDKRGVRIPGETSLAVLSLPAEETHFGGITENAEAIGAAAVDVLAESLLRGETGAPDLPRLVMIEGTFLPGRTIAAPDRMRRDPAGSPGDAVGREA